MLLGECVFQIISCSQVKIKQCIGVEGTSPILHHLLSHGASIPGLGPNGSNIISSFIKAYLFITQLLT